MITDFYRWCSALFANKRSDELASAQARPALNPSTDEYSAYFSRWQNEQLAGIARVSNATDLCEVLENGNGYFRQAALVRCAQLRNAELLPSLLLRLNDWVQSVREQAQSALTSYLAQPDPAIAAKLISLLPQVAALGRGQRADHTPSQSAIERYLQQPVHWQLLKVGLREHEVACARHCFRLLKDASAIPLTELVQLALGRRDVILTSLVFACCDELDSTARSRIYRQLLDSPFNSARAITLREVLQEAGRQDGIPPTPVAPQINKALFDRSALVRDVAWHWHIRQGMDPHEPYRAVWSLDQPSPAQLRCAIWAALKAGSGDLLPALHQQCEHISPTVRGAARLACAQFSTAMLPELMQQALLDQAPAAKRQVKVLNRRFQVPVPFATLAALCQHENGARRILGILDVIEKWDALICVFLIAHRYAAPMQALLEIALMHWVQRDRTEYHGPQQAQRQQLVDLFQGDVPAVLQPGMTSIDEVLRAWPERLHFILKCNRVLA